MADDIKVKITKEINRVEPPRTRVEKIKPEVRGSSAPVSEKPQISEEAKILTEFVPKILAQIEKTEPQAKTTENVTNRDIANSIVEEFVKAIISKKITG